MPHGGSHAWSHDQSPPAKTHRCLLRGWLQVPHTRTHAHERECAAGSSSAPVRAWGEGVSDGFSEEAHAWDHDQSPLRRLTTHERECAAGSSSALLCAHGGRGYQMDSPKRHMHGTNPHRAQGAHLFLSLSLSLLRLLGVRLECACLDWLMCGLPHLNAFVLRKWCLSCSVPPQVYGSRSPVFSVRLAPVRCDTELVVDVERLR